MTVNWSEAKHSRSIGPQAYRPAVMRGHDSALQMGSFVLVSTSWITSAMRETIR